jgi:hypothetical protein
MLIQNDLIAGSVQQARAIARIVAGNGIAATQPTFVWLSAGDHEHEWIAIA